MTEIQLTEIRNYLLDKKLPIDILMEVQDHFVSQINDLEREEDLTFNEAFEQTKKSWREELQPFWDGSMDLEDVSPFVRKMRKQTNLSLILPSVKYGLLIYAVFFICSQIIDKKWFSVLVLLTIVFFVFLPFVGLIRNNKAFKLTRTYNRELSYYQNYTNYLGVGFFYPAYFMCKSAIEEPNHFIEVFQFTSPDGSFWAYFAFHIGIFFMISSSIFTLLAQKIFLRQIEKVKPFLKYLTPSN